MRRSGFSQAHVDFLKTNLVAASHTTATAQERHGDLIAVSILPLNSTDGTELSDGPVPIDTFRVGVASNRWFLDGEELIRMRPVATYVPVRDMITGKIQFHPERAVDLLQLRQPAKCDPMFRAAHLGMARLATALHQASEDEDTNPILGELRMPKFYYAFSSANPPIFESHISEETWAKSEIRIGIYRAWPASFFCRNATSYDVHPVDGSSNPWSSSTSEQESRLMADPLLGTDGTQVGNWCLKDGRAIPLAQSPDEVYAIMDSVRGRSVRNPAYQVLLNWEILNLQDSRRAWLNKISHYSAGTFAFQDADNAKTNAGQLRAKVRELGASCTELMEVMQTACDALGITFTSEQDPGAEIANMLDSPWLPVTLPRAASVQVVRLASWPQPETTMFQCQDWALDVMAIGELGAEGDGFRSLDQFDVKMVKEQLTRREQGNGRRPNVQPRQRQRRADVVVAASGD